MSAKILKAILLAVLLAVLIAVPAMALLGASIPVSV